MNTITLQHVLTRHSLLQRQNILLASGFRFLLHQTTKLCSLMNVRDLRFIKNNSAVVKSAVNGITICFTIQCLYKYFKQYIKIRNTDLQYFVQLKIT